MHGYGQAPYEACSESDYAKLYAQIRHDHPLVAGGDMEDDACATGVCPIR